MSSSWTSGDESWMRGALDWLHSRHERARSALNLVPSETRLSPCAQYPLRTDFYNRYFFNDEHDPMFWQFRGSEEVSDLETGLARESLMRLSAAPIVNLRPVSGMSAMTLVLMGLGGGHGRGVISIANSSGGHYATTELVGRLGMRSLLVPLSHGRVDTDELGRLLRAHDVALVYCDLQNSLDPLDVAAVTDTVARSGRDAFVHVDASHTLGLVLGGVLPNPLDLGASTFGGSTHKSFPGPHKGVVFTRSEHVRALLRGAQFDLLSSHHFAETLALGLAAREFETFGQGYATQVVRNANALGRALQHHGFDVVTASDTFVSHTHQVWVRIGDEQATMALSGVLASAGIRVNVQVDLPGLAGPIFRLGVNEVTFEGGEAVTMQLVADAFAQARDSGAEAAAKLRADARESFGPPHFFTEPLP